MISAASLDGRSAYLVDGRWEGDDEIAATINRRVSLETHPAYRPLEAYLDRVSSVLGLKINTEGAVVSEWEFVTDGVSSKAFCPTGIGGGVDPHCGHGGTQPTKPEVTIPRSQIIGWKKLEGGHNEPHLLEYRDASGQKHRAMFKASDDEAGTIYGSAFPRGSGAAREVAASKIGEAMGLDMVAKTVHAEVDGRKGSLQNWVNDTAEPAHKFIERHDRNNINKSLQGVEGLHEMMYFDALTGNADRHEGNWLIKDNKVALIDNGSSLASSEHYLAESGMYKAQPRLRTLESASAYSRAMLPMPAKFSQGLKKIIANKDEMTGTLKEAGLKPGEIDSFWKRAEHLAKSNFHGFGSDALADLTRAAEGMGMPWDRAFELEEKQFCPTGPGGGVDPSCGSGGGASSPAPLSENERASLRTEFEKIPNKKERLAIQNAWGEYTGGQYREINTALRDDPKWYVHAWQDSIRGLNKTFDFHAKTLARDATLFREVGDDMRNHFKVGTVFSDKGFVSTTTSRALLMTEDPNTLILHIKAKAGTKVVSGTGSEKELVLGRDSRFTVTSVEGNSVHLELL